MQTQIKAEDFKQMSEAIGMTMSTPHTLDVKGSLLKNGYTTEEADELLILTEPVLDLLQQALNGTPSPGLTEHKARYVFIAEKLSIGGKTQKVREFSLNILAQLEYI